MRNQLGSIIALGFLGLAGLPIIAFEDAVAWEGDAEGWEDGSWNSDDSEGIGDATVADPTRTTRQFSPPAPKGFDFRALERAIHAEMNLLRANPAAYAEKLVAQRGSYRGLTRIDKNGTHILLEEGLPALDEAISALQKAHRVPRLAWSDLLQSSSLTHAVDLNTHNITGHAGSNGSQPHERVAQVARTSGWIAENIAFGPRTAEDVVIGLVVDDGVPDRGHRHVLLQPELFVSGTGCGPHPGYGVVCVINYASRVEPKDGGQTTTPVAEAPVEDAFIDEDLAIVDDVDGDVHMPDAPALPPMPTEVEGGDEGLACPWVDDEQVDAPAPAPRFETPPPVRAEAPVTNPWPLLDPRYPADHPRNQPPHLREIRRPIMQTEQRRGGHGRGWMRGDNDRRGSGRYQGRW